MIMLAIKNRRFILWEAPFKSDRIWSSWGNALLLYHMLPRLSSAISKKPEQDCFDGSVQSAMGAKPEIPTLSPCSVSRNSAAYLGVIPRDVRPVMSGHYADGSGALAGLTESISGHNGVIMISE